VLDEQARNSLEDPMSTDIVSRLVAAWNSAKIASIAGLYSEDAVMKHAMMGNVNGRAAIAEAEGPMFAAFSGIEWRSVRSFASDGWVAVEFVVKATNTGSLPTPNGMLPPTGKTLVLEGVSLLRLDAQGLIAKERRYFDTMSFFKQLGLA
jgi:steroid delta-isomerase-like uncharacterized protein